jgi:soluble lytic murein transglycosylase-like protein
VKSSLNTMVLWLTGAFIIIGGYIPVSLQYSKPEKSFQDETTNHEALVPETAPDLDAVEKKKRPPFSDRSIKGARSFHPIIQRAALRYNIDPDLVKAIIMAESEYNPNAISVKGAKGLMQLMPLTARSLGVNDVFNPEQNIHAGVRHFKFLLKQFNGDVKLALAAYNAGSRHVRRYKGIPPFKATKRYLKKVYQYYEFYKENG